MTEGLFLGTGLSLEMSDRVPLCLYISVCSPGCTARLVSYGLCQRQSRESSPFSLLAFVLDVLEEKSWHLEDDCTSLAISAACSLCGTDFIALKKRKETATAQSPDPAAEEVGTWH